MGRRQEAARKNARRDDCYGSSARHGPETASLWSRRREEGLQDKRGPSIAQEDVARGARQGCPTTAATRPQRHPDASSSAISAGEAVGGGPAWRNLRHAHSPCEDTASSSCLCESRQVTLSRTRPALRPRQRAPCSGCHGYADLDGRQHHLHTRSQEDF